ncbi:DNA translocase FtsK [Staphylococcus carnosus]|uniref:DNA translocase FtsK (SpoIIIE) n=1 Tax=Staphylococcus carnosus (strain TM300) TaxID=396513 RepID=B9DPE2_STACT|nr:DNA translocase FtsK [Staphylococcus carnosus]QPT03975.1 DNA translocase FtsK [Staphylococcus carnosus]UQA66700.1 DNA translocase FtsK [Staphylococcus carnosus]UTB78467.1 cell division protein FtsK [Staphylococcus carnosus]UTB88016.1 cell division protein FtsK [Staphylococcus carnosus]UTB90367.1 cell division protein FtsK [Staphylococcus carnosus]
MAQRKKRTTSTKKKTTAKKKSSKKQQNEAPLRYIAAIITVVLVVLGAFQLGIIGRVIDSFFNYLFGYSRYLTYILVILASGFLAYNGKLPKTRRLTGSIVLQFALLFAAQLYLVFTKGAAGDREPVLSYVYRQYDKTHFPNFGGGVIGYYLVHLSIPLVSIVGVVVFTIILFISSIILLNKQRHRDVAKVFLEKLKTGSQSAAIHRKERKERQAERAEEKRRRKEEKELERQEREAAKAQQEEVKDVSDFTEIPIPESEKADSAIPIYGHNDKEKQLKQQGNDQEEASQNVMTESPRKRPKRQLVEDVPEETSKEDMGSISDAGEVENAAYKLPPLTLLNTPAKQKTTSRAEVQKKGRLLETTLKNFNVDAKVTQIKIGPAVTQYEVQPAQGVKVSKIVNLHNDIALALAAKDVRIEAPIPGRSAVGIEVPNDKISLVSLKEVLEEKFPSKNKLEVGLGRDISGDPISVELNKMPHLLVAGSTGSGKSVCINGIIASILLNAKPHEVKLMLIDPKMVELNVYNGIPHLLIPVVTNPHKASQALEKIVAEMERRYDLFQHTGTRNIEGYNKYLKRQNEELEEKQSELPYIVVIVDELADLMMVAGKDVENAIQRITQMARAAGIHLIIATQRPSVDVITGLIKNNIPSRIAFAVSSQTDSRTIIDRGGAEKLLGKGDMLYFGNGGSIQTRIQGAFLSDEEVQNIVNYVVEQQKANYVKEMEPDAPTDKADAQSEDPLYEEAYMFVIEKQKASTSLLQRQFRIGYNRASRLMDDLENNNVIGPQRGSKPRQVLVDLDNGEV